MTRASKRKTNQKNCFMRVLWRLVLCVLLFGMTAPLLAMTAAPTNWHLPESFVYNRMGVHWMATPAPMPYRFVRSVYAVDMGVDEYGEPLVDLLRLNEIKYHNNRFFITTGRTLVVTDNDLMAEQVLSGVWVPADEDSSESEPVWEAFTDLEGVFVTSQGEVYIAEPGAERVIHLSADLEFIRFIGRPEEMPRDDTGTFRPRRVAVDNHGRIYIIAEGIFEGILELNPDGTWNRYFGRIEVTPSPMQMLLRAIQTQAQRLRSPLHLPINFTNLTVDKDGFVFATISVAGTDLGAKKLNARGGNIMRRPANQQVGDLQFNMRGLGGQPAGGSIITLIDVTDYGVYYVFDNRRNRIFAYDEDGHMLYAFGGSGNREGQTNNVSGMTLASGDRLVFADRGSRSFEIFERTPYGILVNNAARLQYNNDFIGAAYYWREVLRYNPFFHYAYRGVGLSLFHHGYFEESMHYFRLAQHPGFYSAAFREVRSNTLRDNFDAIMYTVFGLVAVYFIYRITKRVIVSKRQRGVES